MATPPIPLSQIKDTVAMWRRVLADGFPAVGFSGGPRSALAELTERLGRTANSRKIVARDLDTAVALGLIVPEWRQVDGEWARQQVLRYQAYDDDYRAAAGSRGPQPAGGFASPRRAPGQPKTAPSDTPADAGIVSAGRGSDLTESQIREQVLAALRRGPATVTQLAEKLHALPYVVMGALVDLGLTHSVVKRDEQWHLDMVPPMGSQREMAPGTTAPQLVSDASGEIVFACSSDQHLGSKYSRLDVLNDFYDEVERRGIKVVLNAGNWIDGEAPFNKHDLLVHGADAQLQYLATHYPRRTGVETWAVAGADHEGWLARREGVDIGRYAESTMRAAGREDWRDLGYMEAYVDLVHAGSGQRSKLLVMHPGGGSAYAISYAPQKIIEGFEGGSKPAVLLIGHYHKMSYQLTRNVHCIQCGTTQSQTVFMRQKKLSAHVGGVFVRLKMDERTGAVIECTTTFRNYFDEGYYNGKWSQHGPVTQAPMRAA